MYIKYKGEVGSLLRDISLEYKIPINLKISEAILQQFFLTIIKNLNQEQAIELICVLPTFLKPFCNFSQVNNNHRQILGIESTIVLQPILKILEKYVCHERMSNIYLIISSKILLNSFKYINLSIAETKITKVS